MRSIHFSVGGKRLKGTLFAPKKLQKKNPAVLTIHGWTSRQNRGFMLAKELARRGFFCMTFDLRGHGESGGNIKKISRKSSLDDAVAAYDLLVKQPRVDLKKIIVIGSSYGGYLAALLSTKREVKSLILRVPANYRDVGFTKPLHPVRKSSLHTKWKTKALRAVHNFKGKILIVESQKDEQVPSAIIRSYIKAVKNKKALTHIIMRGAPHSLSKDKPRQKEYTNIVLKWLRP